MHYSIPWEPTGKTEVTHELFDVLLLEEEIDESQFRSKEENERAKNRANLLEIEMPHKLSVEASSIGLDLEFEPTITVNENQTQGVLMRDKNGNLWVVENEKSPPIYVPKCEDSTLIGTKVYVILDQRKDGKRSGKLLPPSQQLRQQQALQQQLEQQQLEEQREQLQKQQRELQKQQQLQQQLRLLEQQRQIDLRKQQEQALQQQSQNTDLACTLMKDKAGHYWALSSASPSSAQKYVFIHPNDLNGAKEGENVRVQLHERADGKLSGLVVLGQSLPSQSQPSASTPSATNSQSSDQKMCVPIYLFYAF
jgi:hypothetical protein